MDVEVEEVGVELAVVVVVVVVVADVDDISFYDPTNQQTNT